MVTVAALCGLGFGAGLLLIAAGLRRTPRAHDSTTPLAAVWERLIRGRRPAQLAAVALAAVVVGLVTGWPVAALLTALAGWALPGLLDAERARARQVARWEAIASWTESLRDTLAAAAGLEQTLLATAATAPAPIRPHVEQLAAALRAGARLPDALRAFATDIADPTADLVVASLLLASTRTARQLGPQLGALAAATREQVAAARRTETHRARAAGDARIIIATTLAMTVGLVVLNRGYLHPYDSLGGQIVLAVIGLLFAAGFRWLHRLSRAPTDERLLADGEGFAATEASERPS